MKIFFPQWRTNSFSREKKYDENKFYINLHLQGEWDLWPVASQAVIRGFWRLNRTFSAKMVADELCEFLLILQIEWFDHNFCQKCQILLLMKVELTFVDLWVVFINWSWSFSWWNHFYCKLETSLEIVTKIYKILAKNSETILSHKTW